MASKQPKKRKPRRKKPREGEIVNYEHPVWEPPLGLARIYVDEFMWMGEIELVEHFNRVVRWHYAGQHQFDCEVAHEQREERLAEEVRLDGTNE